MYTVTAIALSAFVLVAVVALIVMAARDRVPGADTMIGDYRAALLAGGFNARCVRFNETVAPTSIKLLDIQQVRRECGVRVALQPLPHAAPSREGQHA